jgi:1-acyl-sn-glycerol-3-phosphate acyltransferase
MARSPLELVLRTVRSIGFALNIVAVFSFLCLVWPVSWLNPVLRAFGTPHRVLPSNLIIKFVAWFVLLVGGIRPSIHPSSDAAAVEMLHSGPCVAMYTHGSNFDPVIVSYLALGVKHIYKRELGKIPIFGWSLVLYRHVAVDRANREKAISQLEKAVRVVTRNEQSMAIAPEGTRSRTGDLLEFKKGPFHTAIAAKEPVVPVVIRGAYELLPPKHKTWDAGDVDVVVLPAISSAGKDVESLSSEVRASIESCIEQRKADEEKTRKERLAARVAKNRNPLTAVPAAGVLVATYVAFAWLW